MIVIASQAAPRYECHEPAIWRHTSSQIDETASPPVHPVSRRQGSHKRDRTGNRVIQIQTAGARASASWGAVPRRGAWRERAVSREINVATTGVDAKTVT